MFSKRSAQLGFIAIVLLSSAAAPMPRERTSRLIQTQAVAHDTAERTGWTYDSRGRVKDHGQWVYDRADRLVEVRVSDPVGVGIIRWPVAQYTYDANGLRTSAVEDNIFATYSVRDEQGSIVYLRGLRSPTTSGWVANFREFLFVNSQPVGFMDYIEGAEGRPRFFGRDRRGSVVVEDWAPGRAPPLLIHREYSPYGIEMRGDDSRSSNPTMFTTASERSVPTGLHSMKERFESPSAGRFMAPDKVGFVMTDPTSFNPYLYARNDPINFNDPSGLFADGIWDSFNVSIGFKSVQDNVAKGNWGDAAVDAVGLAIDTAALMTPGVVAGAATVIKAGRHADDVADLAKAADNVADAAKTADKAADAAKGADKVSDAAKGVLNPKIYKSLERQLQDADPKSIHKALRGAEKALAEHQAKLPTLKYKSQVEGTIENVQNQIVTLKQFIADKGL